MAYIRLPTGSLLAWINHSARQTYPVTPPCLHTTHTLATTDGIVQDITHVDRIPNRSKGGLGCDIDRIKCMNENSAWRTGKVRSSAQQCLEMGLTGPCHNSEWRPRWRSYCLAT